MMVKPEIVYYARLTYDTGSGKIPKYVVTAEAGYYPAMDNLRGRDGRISVYLQEVNRLYPRTRHRIIIIIDISQLCINSIRIIPIAIHNRIKPITFFIRFYTINIHILLL